MFVTFRLLTLVRKVPQWEEQDILREWSTKSRQGISRKGKVVVVHVQAKVIHVKVVQIQGKVISQSYKLKIS
jgi:hypothetical protein